MKRRMYLTLLFSALLLLAVAGWLVEGVRYGVGGSRRPGLAPAR